VLYQCIAEALYLGNSSAAFLRESLEIYAERVPPSRGIMCRVEEKWNVLPHEPFLNREYECADDYFSVMC
jgi:hypothetical protein